MSAERTIGQRLGDEWQRRQALRSPGAGFAVSVQRFSESVQSGRNPDARGIRLEGRAETLDLRGVDLRWSSWRDIDIERPLLSGANLRGVELRDCHLGPSPSSAHVHEVVDKLDLRSTRIADSSLVVSAEGADLRGATVVDSVIGRPGSRALPPGLYDSLRSTSRGSLAQSDLRGVHLERTVIYADLTGSDLRGATLDKVVFYGQMDGVKLDGVDLSQCAFRGAARDSVLERLGGTLGSPQPETRSYFAAERDGHVFEEDLEGVDFRQASLVGAQFRGHVRNCNFEGALLSGARFDKSVSRTDFRGADLTGADLAGTSGLMDISGRGVATDYLTTRGRAIRDANIQGRIGREPQSHYGTRHCDFRGASLDRTHIAQCFDSSFEGVQLNRTEFGMVLASNFAQATTPAHASFIVDQQLDHCDLSGTHISARLPRDQKFNDYSAARADIVFLPAERGEGAGEPVLSGLDFRGARVLFTDRQADQHVTFFGSVFKQTNLSGSELPNGRFTDCDLTGARMDLCNLTDVQFRGGRTYMMSADRSVTSGAVVISKSGQRAPLAACVGLASDLRPKGALHVKDKGRNDTGRAM